MRAMCIISTSYRDTIMFQSHLFIIDTTLSFIVNGDNHGLMIREII